MCVAECLMFAVNMMMGFLLSKKAVMAFADGTHPGFEWNM